MTEVLNINNLSYKLNRTTILDQVNLTLPTGNIVGLLGANGAGKTTIMRLISGAAKHYRGQINVTDQAVVDNMK